MDRTGIEKVRRDIGWWDDSGVHAGLKVIRRIWSKKEGFFFVKIVLITLDKFSLGKKSKGDARL